MISPVQNTAVEADYPLEFRQKDATALGEHLRFRHSVELVGMKHVGIGNFLSFFLNHPDVVDKYINHGEKHLFISVDLNDLVEREIYPFWILMFKRLVDQVENSEIAHPDKKEVSALFLASIQSQDVFLTIENLRKALNIIVKNETLPTVFLLRLDRLKEVMSEDFFGNLEGLVDATGQKLAYVFTSYKSLGEIAPVLFEKKYLTLFSHKLYIKPANETDTKVIFETFQKKYNLDLDAKLTTQILLLSGGHVQYLQLTLIILTSKMKEGAVPVGNLLTLIVSDERINLLCEEIWESLTGVEQEVLKKIRGGKKVSEDDKKNAQYLWDTGIVAAKDSRAAIFNGLFESYLASSNSPKEVDSAVDFTKKENLLFKMLLDNRGEVCEREAIINTVWPEYEEVGVSDWTIDRLVARLRTKLKLQNSNYSIKTVRTRGYRLVEEG